MNGLRFDVMSVLLARPCSRRAIATALVSGAGPLALLDRRRAQARRRRIRGSLTTSDFIFSRCGATGTLYFDPYVRNHGSGPLSLHLKGRGDAIPLVDPYLFLYSNFDRSTPCDNIVGQADDGGCEFDSYLSVDLPAGTYTIVVTSFDQEDVGQYTLKRNVALSCP